MKLNPRLQPPRRSRGLPKGTSKKHHPLTYLREGSLSWGNLPSVVASVLSLAHEEKDSKSKSHWPEPCKDSLGRLSAVRESALPSRPLPHLQGYTKGWGRQDFMA